MNIKVKKDAKIRNFSLDKFKMFLNINLCI